MIDITCCKPLLLTPLLCGLLALPVARAAESAAPLVIAPMIEGFGLCQARAEQYNPDQAIEKCARDKNYGVADLQQALDQLEPGGARGKVQIGYTVGINLLEFTGTQQGPERMAAYTATLKNIKRPVVLYLFANHFAGSGIDRSQFADALAKFPDQSVPNEKYFEGGILPLSLNMAPTLSINKRRFEALAEVGRWYKKLPADVRARVVAITMAGELHHFYDDFANGMGRFDAIRVTDYGPDTVRNFQSWLAQRHGDINRLNALLGTSFSGFDKVIPPSRDIRKTTLKHIGEHFDSYAHGVLPIEGWLDALPPGHALTVYLDGKPVGTAEYGLNRQDVYEAVETVKTARVGFRYLLDFSNLPRGKHTVQVIVDGPKGFELAKRTISIMGQSQASIQNLSRETGARSAPKEVRFWLDRPANDQAFFYNPLAKDWYEYRSGQVTQAYDAWFDRAVASGLPAEKLYTHQIAVATVGGWNPVLAASDGSLQDQHRYKKGINVYAGSASVELLRRHYLGPGEAFGVPEFHTQAWKDPAAPLRILREFQSGGAAFVSPYFLSMIPDKYRSDANAHNKFRLSPDNRHYGSNHLYQAITELAKE